MVGVNGRGEDVTGVAAGVEEQREEGGRGRGGDDERAPVSQGIPANLNLDG